MRILIRIFINAVALWVTAWLMPDVNINGDWQMLLVVAIVFGLVNTFIRPLAKLVTLPINILSLGLFTFVLNGLLLMLTAYITRMVTFGEGGFFHTLWTAILASIVISIVSTILGWALPNGKNR